MQFGHVSRVIPPSPTKFPELMNNVLEWGLVQCCPEWLHPSPIADLQFKMCMNVKGGLIEARRGRVITCLGMHECVRIVVFV